MRKASLLAILILAFGTMTTLTIRPAEASVSDYDWLGQVHYYDPYWVSPSPITVFIENSNAKLMVEVHNDLFPSAPLNVSAVKVWLDWNQNYSSTEASVTTPLVIQPGLYRTFTISFTVPPTSTASNLVKHSYTVYIEQANATTGPKQITLHSSQHVTDAFVVYSTIQQDAQNLYDELYLINPTSGSWTFQSDEAGRLWSSGTLEYQLGERNHKVGNFSNARTYYETALQNLYEALSTETSYQTNLENLDILDKQAQIALAQADAEYKEAQVKYQEAIANATMKQADAAMIQANASMRQADAEFAIAEAMKMQANAWVVFGIGFVVFGLAAVVWAYRRPIGPPS